MQRDFASSNVTVMGLGRFGGGAGVCRWLVDQGANVTVTDMQSETELTDALHQIADITPHMKLHLGGHDQRDFAACDCVIANPAVPQPWENSFLTAAKQAGVPVTTEIRLLTERLNRDRVIGITGTAGKSTTAAMVHHILQRAGVTSHLGGNIGGSLLESLSSIRSDDWVVLELSSFMLYWLGEGVGYADAPGWSPHIAAITNIQRNHLDWHGTFEHYQHSKQTILRDQTAADHAVTGKEVHQRTIPLRIPGKHNQTNAALACHLVARAIGMDADDAAHLLDDFTGLPHRLSLIAERDGMRFFDDSKSTTPQATVLAVQAFDQPHAVHLIAGGYDKGSDLSPISDLAPSLAGLYAIGSTARQLVKSSKRNAWNCTTLEQAVQQAISRMQPGDVLLLSPGCASWDQFTNYEQRGKAFYNAVMQR